MTVYLKTTAAVCIGDEVHILLRRFVCKRLISLLPDVCAPFSVINGTLWNKLLYIRLQNERYTSNKVFPFVSQYSVINPAAVTDLKAMCRSDKPYLLSISSNISHQSLNSWYHISKFFLSLRDSPPMSCNWMLQIKMVCLSACPSIHPPIFFFTPALSFTQGHNGAPAYFSSHRANDRYLACHTGRYD